MHEIVINLHMHTRYSDGAGSHRDIARAALRRARRGHRHRSQRLDRGNAGYYEESGRACADHGGRGGA